MGAIANALFRCQSDDDNPQRLANQHLNIGSNCTRAPLWQLSTFLMDSATAWVACIPLAWIPADLVLFPLRGQRGDCLPGRIRIEY
jgi:hypothetical protein